MNLLFFIVLFFFSCLQEKKNSKEVVARVNEVVLTKEALVHLVGSAPAGRKTYLHAINRWVEKTLLYNAAIGSGLNKDRRLLGQKEAFYKDLLVSSYISAKTEKLNLLLKNEVSEYYIKNKKGFTRAEEEVVVKHFVSKTIKEAKTIRKELKKNRKIEKIIKKHKPTTRLLRGELLKDSLVGFVFSGNVGDVLGPKKHGEDYHVFQILKKHKKGSIRGLELVYDEIYQRLYKEKEISFLAQIIDSLYVGSDVFVSKDFFK